MRRPTNAIRAVIAIGTLCAARSWAAPESTLEPARQSFREPVVVPAQPSAKRYAKLSANACRAELVRRHLQTKPARGNVRGIATPVRLTGPIRGVRIIAPGGSSRYGILDCRLVLAIDELVKIAEKHGVVALRADNLYRPKAKLPGKHTPSQHAYGLAMDVTMFELSDGSSLLVERDWQSPVGAPACGPEAELGADATRAAVRLRNLVCELARAGVFNHLLTPSFNAAHRTHLHLDIKRDASEMIVR